MKKETFLTINWNISDIKNIFESNKETITKEKIDTFLKYLDLEKFKDNQIETGINFLQNVFNEFSKNYHLYAEFNDINEISIKDVNEFIDIIQDKYRDELNAVYLNKEALFICIMQIIYKYKILFCEKVLLYPNGEGIYKFLFDILKKENIL